MILFLSNDAPLLTIFLVTADLAPFILIVLSPCGRGGSENWFVGVWPQDLLRQNDLGPQPRSLVSPWSGGHRPAPSASCQSDAAALSLLVPTQCFRMWMLKLLRPGLEFCSRHVPALSPSTSDLSAASQFLLLLKLRGRIESRL